MGRRERKGLLVALDGVGVELTGTKLTGQRVRGVGLPSLCFSASADVTPSEEVKYTGHPSS